ncbi:MAG: VWA domain-containing protein [Nitrospirae bacterium]|nr:VWA domain-containing protein [Nitrospirota bacterium]
MGGVVVPGIHAITGRAALCLALLCLALLLPPPLYAVEIAGFRVEQAYVELPNIKVYAEILNNNGVSISDTADNVTITATVGSIQTSNGKISPFDKSGEGIGYVFLVDISKSLKPPQFEHMRAAMSGIIDNMTQKDMAAIITFGKDVKVASDYTADKNELKAKIKALRVTDDQTQLHLGLMKAVEMGRRIDAVVPARKAIITLSDGEDDFAGGMTKDEITDMLKVDRIPIYAIGFYNPPATPKKDEHLKTLGEFARRSGGELIRANDLPYDQIYTTLNSRIRKAFIITLNCDNCMGDGQALRLQLALTSGTKQLTDGMDIRILPRAKATPAPTPKPAPPEGITTKQIYIISGAAAVIAVLAVVFIIIRRKKKKRQPQQDNAPHQAMPDEDITRQFKEGPSGPVRKEQALPQRRVRLKFTAISPAQRTKAYEAILDKPIVMGRNPAYCAVTIPDDEEISGVHCEISKSGGKFYIKDLGSTNGTLVNGVPLTSIQKIDEGDTITLGQTQIRMTILAGQ